MINNLYTVHILAAIIRYCSKLQHLSPMPHVNHSEQSALIRSTSCLAPLLFRMTFKLTSVVVVDRWHRLATHMKYR